MQTKKKVHILPSSCDKTYFTHFMMFYIKITIFLLFFRFQDKPFEVRTEDNISFLVKSPDTVLKAGSPVKIPISVSYNPSLGIPKVVAVRLNAREVCPIKKPVRISPCPSVFLFDKVQNSTDKWSGVLSLKSEYELQGLWIRVTLDAAVTDLEVRDLICLNNN